MVFTKKNEEAVSPVIGVILMVAITVILAAVIAAFVFGMAGNIQSTKTVAFTLQRTATNTVGLTFQGGADAASLISVTTSVDGATPVPQWSSKPTIGSTRSGIAAIANSRIVVVGKFQDGTEQVLIDKTL